jgi:glycosidase
MDSLNEWAVQDAKFSEIAARYCPQKKQKKEPAIMEFHVSRQSRDRYGFNAALFQLSGNVLFTNFSNARAFAQKINQQRNLVNAPEQAARAGEINAMGLIDEILHIVVDLYRQQIRPQVMEQALAWLKMRVGAAEVEQTLLAFATEFPPLAVYQGELTPEAYSQGSTEGVPNEQILLEEMLMLWLENKNPAYAAYQELFDDASLQANSAYPHVIAELYQYFETQPKFGPEKLNLVDLLRSPAVAVPHSLFGQLEYIRDRWAELLGSRLGKLLRRLLNSLDLIREEQTQHGFFGPGPVAIPVYDAQTRALEAENFSPDRAWMPQAVIIAKNTYVWLDQLSQQYQRRITHLGDIPDEELEKLARWGFNGLWLIGLWERSRASAHIKQMMGNPEAIASAYSLFDYRIADDLGGDDAYQKLHEKAARFGIRLASDMVPNHMGIDSPWVTEHPEWFLSLDYPPYPSYTFDGPNLSAADDAEIYLEDHYYSRSDAAVVFKEVDRRNGQVRYIYHGNDGTTMPWNDTAQLNYLMPEVREAVIQTILAVARRFPIIRFDAAMTLAKQHYQRLWFPTPGTGGAIPSRAEHGLTKEQFDQALPVEFWREVVDRVAKEAPDTLLLAEAFWMMEGFFVRTLGMHRVYNSAFMNMLRDEENAKYRILIKNTLEFDPEILKRYVNFMNNPDERTAVDQFGKGDKYFGICGLMSTMPGLPMFGHGQVEGFAEKYGMEFKRPYWNEQPDPDLVERHRREIFPLLHRRALFAGVENFLLYDFFTQEGGVNEDVFAYSNGQGVERGLVVYNNKFNDTAGWVRTSVGFSVKTADGGREIIQRTLGEGLNLHADADTYCIYRDVSTDLEYIRPSRELVENGLFMTLHAYEFHALVDIHEVVDDEAGSYRRIYDYLAGRGVPSVENALQELFLQAVLGPARQLLNPGYLRFLIDARLQSKQDVLPAHLIDEAHQKLEGLLNGIQALTGHAQNRDRLQQELALNLRLALALPSLTEQYPMPGSAKYAQAAGYLRSGLGEEDWANWAVILSWVYLHSLGALTGAEHPDEVTAGWVSEWLFDRVLDESVHTLAPQTTVDVSRLVRILIEQQNWFDQAVAVRKSPASILETWLSNNDIQIFLHIHRFNEVLWFDKDSFETLIWWMTSLAVMGSATNSGFGASLLIERLLAAYKLARTWLKAEEQSEYQVAKLLEALDPQAAEKTTRSETPEKVGRTEEDRKAGRPEAAAKSETAAEKAAAEKADQTQKMK